MANLVLVVVFSSIRLSGTVVAELSILAPEIICPDNGNNTFSRPDYSIIRILSETPTEMNLSWSVSWNPITTVSQRLTIMTWNSVRDLEKKLNGPQTEPLLSVIKNDELVSGVNYILNLTANTSDEIMTKSLSIKYNKDNEDATVSMTDAFSLVLLGGRSTYPELEYIIVADVTTCSTTQYYYFSWRIFSTISDHTVNVFDVMGSRLELPRFTLNVGEYELECQLKNQSDHVLIKEVKIPIHTCSRGLDVFLNIDCLVVSTDSAFIVESMVINHDDKDYAVEYEWKCFNNGTACDFIDNSVDSSFNFSSGIPCIGEYLISLTVSGLNKTANANATVITVISNLPILHIASIPRILNQDTATTVSGKATRVTPSCSITWYFAAEGSLNSPESHGVAISETSKLFSLEENFLGELADFSNDTESVEIEVDITSAGRARIVAECNRTSSFSPESIELIITYAEVHFQLNGSPELEDLVVSPDTGLALETLFQIRSRAKDFDRPLRYSFYCAIGPNVTLLLGSYLGYETVETFLPYIGGETLIWVEVCDALGACSKSKASSVQVRPSSGNTFDLINEYTLSFIRRCDIVRLKHVAISGLISYSNAGQSELASLFTRTLLESLPGLHSGCLLPQYQYAAILGQLAAAGLDINPLLA